MRRRGPSPYEPHLTRSTAAENDFPTARSTSKFYKTPIQHSDVRSERWAKVAGGGHVGGDRRRPSFTRRCARPLVTGGSRRRFSRERLAPRPTPDDSGSNSGDDEADCLLRRLRDVIPWDREKLGERRRDKVRQCRSLRREDSPWLEPTSGCSSGSLHNDEKRPHHKGCGWHGDDGRNVVVGLSLDFGQVQGQAPVKVTLNHGDLYIMGGKTTGTDWKSSKCLTVRHACGDPKCTVYKPPSERATSGATAGKPEEEKE